MYMMLLFVFRIMFVVCICLVYIEYLKDKVKCVICFRNGVVCNWMNFFKLYCSLKFVIVRYVKKYVIFEFFLNEKKCVIIYFRRCLSCILYEGFNEVSC